MPEDQLEKKYCGGFILVVVHISMLQKYKKIV